jgi:hypothetical protein
MDHQAQPQPLRRVGCPPVVVGQPPCQRTDEQFQQQADRNRIVSEDEPSVASIDDPDLGADDPSLVETAVQQAVERRAQCRQVASLAPTEVLESTPTMPWTAIEPDPSGS